jgi:hypothetical protein
MPSSETSYSMTNKELTSLGRVSSKSNFLLHKSSQKSFKPLYRSNTNTIANTSQYPDETLKTFTDPQSPIRARRFSLAAQNIQSNIKVVARFRPLNNVETDLMKNSIGSICYEACSENTVQIKTDSVNNKYTFDKVFPITCQQEDIFNYIGKETLNDVFCGYNGTIFTYGQSGSGKTYTLYGNNIYDENGMGLIPRIV